MNFKGIIFYAMIVLVIGMCVWLIWTVRSESFQCMSQPYSFPIKLLEKANNAQVSCNCLSIPKSGKSISFIMNSSGLYADLSNVQNREPFTEFNFSGLNLTK